MARFHFSGAETALFDAGTPIGVKCGDGRYQTPSHAEPLKVELSRDVESVLFEQMRVYREHYVWFSEDADNRTRLAQDTEVDGDGKLAWRQAHAAQCEALEALERYR